MTRVKRRENFLNSKKLSNSGQLYILTGRERGTERVVVLHLYINKYKTPFPILGTNILLLLFVFLHLFFFFYFFYF